MSTFFKSGLYATFLNPTIMNKIKQGSHSKQETISVIFTHPSPNPSAPQSQSAFAKAIYNLVTRAVREKCVGRAWIIWAVNSQPQF